MATGLSSRGGEHARMLVARYFLLNIVGIVGLYFAWQSGWIDTVVRTDTSYISIAIATLFVVGEALCGWRIIKVGVEFDRIKRTNRSEHLDQYRMALQRSSDPGAIREALLTRMTARVAYIDFITGLLVMLGLLGTVIGIYFAMTGAYVELSKLSGTDINQLQEVLTPLFGGIGIAIITTMVGCVASIWLGATVHVLNTGNANLCAALIENGSEANVLPTS